MMYLTITFFISGALYLFSYYGWVRTFDGRGENPRNGMFSLDYERVPGHVFSSILQHLHAPLRWLDEGRYTRLYDTSNRRMVVPDFDGEPDLSKLHDSQSNMGAK